MVNEPRRPPSGVRLRGLEKRFDVHVALHPLDLTVEPGELMVLVGPSGCGKTTVLRLIAGLEEPTAGEVVIGDRTVNDLEPAERDMAMVFQHYALYPHKTVRENLAFGLRMRKRPPEEIATRVAWAAGVLGLETLLDRRPGQLSGGQQQRVAFGRAMVRQPEVFLFDEPLSNLDAKLRTEMRREIADLHDRLGSTMIYVTHDQVEAMTLGQRIAVLHEGRLRQCAPPLELYRRPADLYVAGFIGSPSINLAAGVVEPGMPPVFVAAPGAAERAGGVNPMRIAVAGIRPSAAVTIGVRPEALALVAPGDPASHARATVRRVEVIGNEALVYLDGLADEPWVARASADWPGATGDVTGIRLRPESVLFFDSSTGVRLDAGADGQALATPGGHRP